MDGSVRSRFDDRVDDVMLPRHRHSAEVRLVGDFVDQVVELVQFRDDLAHERDLDSQQGPIPIERVDVVPPNGADTVHVVDGVHRAERPLHVFVHRTEEAELHDDVLRGAIGDEVLESLEVRLVPLREIELVAAVRVSWLVAARPGREVAARPRGKSVAGNLERPLGLDVGAADQARVVQALGSERIRYRRKSKSRFSTAP